MKETKDYQNLLMQVLSDPSLMAFSVVVSHLGVDGALMAIKEGELPEEVSRELSKGGWSLEDMPPIESLELIMIGVKVAGNRRLDHRTTQSVPDTARKLGIEPKLARRGIEMMRRYCAATLRVHKEFTRR